MLNSVSFVPTVSTGILPNNRGNVTVGNKTYPVKKVPYNDPLKCTFVQEYRDVVVIDGKEYPVQKVSNPLSCDGTKDVVVIDGKTYNVNNNLLGSLSLPKLNTII